LTFRPSNGGRKIYDDVSIYFTFRICDTSN
jgi:hypothetical protein